MQFRPNSVFGRQAGEKPIGQEDSAGIQGGVNAPPFLRPQGYKKYR